MRAPPPQLMDELVEEVLLRLPPGIPASLVRAGLVCKRWCRLVSDAGFQRRFIEFHRRAAPPPMLGFVVCSHHDDEGVFHDTRFVPTPAAGGLPHATHPEWTLCDSRHGLMLLYGYDHAVRGGGYRSLRLVVWNPITGGQRMLPAPPLRGPDPSDWAAAVLCAAAAGGGAGGAGAAACDHLDCHCGPSTVVLVGSGRTKTFICIYSSEAGAWTQPVFAPHSGGSSIVDDSVRSVLVGNALYFAFHEFEQRHFNILEYDLGTREVSVMELPRACKSGGSIELTTMEDGRLGFVRVENYLRLCLWSREVEEASAAAAGYGTAGWVLCKAISLQTLFPFYFDPWECHPDDRYLAGSVEGVSIIFLTLKDGLFMVDLRSGQVTKVYPHQGARFTVPYINFCTPVFRAPSTLLHGP